MIWRADLKRPDAWLLLATLVFLVAAVASTIQLYRLESTLVANIRSGNWLVVEARSEFQKTLIASKTFRLNPRPEMLAELTTRFDILWSRIPLILDSEEGKEVRLITAVRDNAQHVRDMLPLLDAELSKVVAGDARSAERFETTLSELGPSTEEMSRVILLQDEARYQVDSVARGAVLTVGMFLLSVLAGMALAIGNLLQRHRMQVLYQQQAEIDKIRAAQLTAIENSGEGIAMFDARGRLSYSNEAFHHLIGDDFSRTLTRAHWRQFLSREGAQAILRGLQGTLNHGAWKGEVVGRGLDNAERNWEVAVTRSQEGGFVALMRDLAEHKAHERERVLMQEQMHRVEKMEAVGRLAGGVAHDFNNILAAITGYGSLLQGDLARQLEQRGMVDQIMIAAGRGKELVQSILSFSRTEKVERRSTDVGAACREAATMAAISIEGPAVFETDIDPSPMPAAANATQITRAIVNLCINARDALVGGKGKVRLEAARILIDGGRTAGLHGSGATKVGETLMRFDAVDPDHVRAWIGTLAQAGAHARIRVSDEGSGIPLDIMQRMFDPFFTTKELGRGTGLGLSSVLGIVTAHGGAIAVDSSIGKGTVFDVLLPIEDGAEQSAPAGGAGAESGAGDDRRITGTRILVVDDDPAVGRTMVSMLERLGCEPSLCESAMEALELLADEPDLFDVIVTDLMMPQMSGLELAAELRARGFKLPVVLVSGRLQEAPAEERARLGISFAIGKPFMLREVAGAVWGALGQRTASAGDGAGHRGGEPGGSIKD